MLQVNQQVLKTGVVGSLDYSLEIHGRRMDFEARTVASGPDEVVVIVRNITDRKQAEQRAFALALERERVTLLTRFIQESSHEFRTPLSIIEVNLHLLTRFAENDDQLQRLGQIDGQVARIAQLVDILVQMSRLESGLPLALRPCDPTGIAEQAVMNMRSAAAAKNVVIEFNSGDQLSAINADPKELLSALQQLLDNAIRYTPAGGDKVVLSTFQHGDTITYTVVDHGVGIPQDALPHIFERFYRLDSAHSTPGLGLGLSLTQKIVELHEGVIEVESQVGEGSRFTIHLPCSGLIEHISPMVH